MRKPCCQYFRLLLAASAALGSATLRSEDDKPFSKEDSIEFAQSLLTAKELAEFSLDLREDLIPQFADRLAAACESDPALGEKALRRAVQLFMSALERHRFSNNGNEGNGNNFASVLAAKIGEKLPGFGTLQVSWRLYHHDIIAQFGHPSWPALGGWDKTLSDAFEKGGGWEDRSAGLRAMLGPLRQIIGKDPPGLMLVGFAGFANKLDPWELLMVGEAAGKISLGHDADAPLANVLSVALRIAQSRLLKDMPSKPDDERMPGNATGRDDLLGWLNDPQIPELNRFALAAHLVRDLGPLRDAAIIRSGMESGIKALEWDQPTNGYAWEPLLIAFNTMPLNDAWRMTAERFCRAWIHRCRFENKPDELLLRFSPYPVCTYPALETVARLGRSADFKSLAALHHLTSAQTFVLMVRYGLHDLASAWLHETPAHRFAEIVAGLSFREDDQQAVDKFCATLHQPEYELLARIHVANNPPSDDGMPRISSGKLPSRWDARMAALVPAFRSTKFESEKVRDLCLFLLSDSPSAGLLLREEIAGSPLRSPVFPRNPGYQQLHDALRVASAFVCNGFAEGTTEPLEDTMKTIGSLVSSTNDWRHYASVSFLTGEIYEAALLLTPESNDEGLKCWRDAIDTALGIFHGNPNNGSEAQAMMAHAVLHLLTGSMAELDKWRASLSEEKRNSCLQVIKDYRGDLPANIGAFCRKNADGLRPFEQRRRIILLFLNDPWLRQKTSGLPTLLHSLVKRGITTPDELLGAAAEIAAADKGSGRRLRELAALAWHAGRRELAASLLDQAAATTEVKDLKSRYPFAGGELK